MFKKILLTLAIIFATALPSYAQVYNDDDLAPDAYLTPSDNSDYYYSIDAPVAVSYGYYPYGFRYWHGHRYYRYHRYGWYHRYYHHYYHYSPGGHVHFGFGGYHHYHH